MNFNRATTLALGSLGAAIGAIAANSPQARQKVFSTERWVGSLLGGSVGLAVGVLTESAQPGLGALSLSDGTSTPLKRRPIEIVRTDRPTLDLNPVTLIVPNPADRPLIATRLLTTA